MMEKKARRSGMEGEGRDKKKINERKRKSRWKGQNKEKKEDQTLRGRNGRVG